MLGGFKREEARYTDPEEVMAGRCMTCSTVVSCLRKDAVKRGGNELGAWGDLLSRECPGCKARVFLMLAKDFRATNKGM